MSARPDKKPTPPESDASQGQSGPQAASGLNAEEFARNMLTVGMKSQQLLVDFAARMTKRDGPIDPLNISGAMMALAKAMSGDRDQVMAAQAAWWNNFMTLWESTARRMLGGDAAPALVEPRAG